MAKLLNFDKTSKNYGFLFLIVFILLAIPLTVRLVQQSEQVGKPSQAAATRDPMLQPFASWSIWNLPIGNSAQRTSSNILSPTGWGVFPDQNQIILKPTAPMTPIYYNGDAWHAGIVNGRCSPQGGVMQTAPLPANYIIHGIDGNDTPNYSAAILMPDGHTLKQNQPLTHCTTSSSWTSFDFVADADLYTDGIYGAQGGSGLSSIGGAIRRGELVPSGKINHALKLILNSDNFKTSPTFVWPAKQADSCAPGCYGNRANFWIGSLLGLKPAFNINSLQTGPGKIVAQAMLDYGAYVVDAGWDPITFAVEDSPDGNMEDEFRNVWGFSFSDSNVGSTWSQDIIKIMQNTDVINNWTQSAYNSVVNNNKTSTNKQGAGGGSPRVALSCIPQEPSANCGGTTGGDTTNPTATLTAPTNGATVSGSTVTLSANASDNVGVTIVDFFVNNQSVGTDTSSPYSVNWNSTTIANGTYSVFARAFDAAGNQGNSATINITVNNATQPPPPPPPPPPPSSGNSVTLTIGGTPSSGNPYSVVATTTVTGVVKIDFLVNGSLYHSESSAPYSMFDDNGTVPNTGKVRQASYVLTANVYQQGGTTVLATTQQTITEGTSTKVGDVNGDGSVGSADLAILISTWGSTTDLRADLNKDGKISSADLAVLISKWGT